METLKLALDWTPNINHIGFFIAKEKGFYESEGIDLEVSDPSEDNYKTTPAKKVELGLVDFALCPTESIISYRNKKSPFKMIAIATILQKDLSAIVVKKENNINSPKDLDHKSYASYKARYEDEIVKQMIRNDGGKGLLKVKYPEKLGIWESLLNNTYDSTWIFLNWEGVEAEISEKQMVYFKMSDYGIPYSFSPVIAINEEILSTKSLAYSKFLKATKKGYLFATENPKAAIEIFKKVIPKKDQKIDLNKALLLSTEAFGNLENWGKMSEESVKSFLNWIAKNNLEKQTLRTNEIVNNSLL